MTIPTISRLRTNRRRIEMRLRKADQVLAAMKAGDALHLQHTRHGPRWTLSSGRGVSDNVARLVIASASVAGVGDALFSECPAQTWRWWNA